MRSPSRAPWIVFRAGVWARLLRKSRLTTNCRRLVARGKGMAGASCTAGLGHWKRVPPILYRSYLALCRARPVAPLPPKKAHAPETRHIADHIRIRTVEDL